MTYTDEAREVAATWPELRPDHKGRFDEVVARFADGMVHVETMTDKSVYIGFYRGEGPGADVFQLWISADKKLRYNHEPSRGRILQENHDGE